MLIEFDPAKDTVNRDKHGVPLAFGEAVWADPDVVILPTIRVEDGERRFKAVGLVEAPVDGGACLSRPCDPIDFGQEKQQC